MRQTIFRSTMGPWRDDGVVGSAPRLPGHVLEDNTDPALLELEGQFRKQAQYRYKCPMAAIEVRAKQRCERA